VVALERNAAMRPAKRCSSLLRQGRQHVAARCCGESATLYSSLLRRGQHSEFRNEEDKWIEIKTKIHLNTSLDKKQTDDLWSLLEQF
jgi:hypothetical protein